MKYSGVYVFRFGEVTGFQKGKEEREWKCGVGGAWDGWKRGSGGGFDKEVESALKFLIKRVTRPLFSFPVPSNSLFGIADDIGDGNTTHSFR